MKESPLLMNGDMVRATLANQKTMTRRLDGLKEINENPDDWHLQDLSVDPELMGRDKNGNEKIIVKRGLIATFEHTEIGEVYRNIRCPFGQVGDFLYVRETWAQKVYDPNRIYYRADNELGSLVNLDGNKWRPSIHMPRRVARIFLQIDEIRVERERDISNEDAMSEGIKEFKLVASNGTTLLYGVTASQPEHGLTPKDGFEILFESIYGEEFSKSNPWVWALKFHRVEV